MKVYKPHPAKKAIVFGTAADCYSICERYRERPWTPQGLRCSCIEPEAGRDGVEPRQANAIPVTL